MKTNTIKSYLRSNLSNLPGWRTKRKIIVIESDDWGSVRMPSIETFNYLSAKGLDLTSQDSRRYNVNDTLAGKEDLTALFDTLIKHKDKNNRSAVFTPVSVVANPDFKKIKEDNFKQYYFEPFPKTLERYQGDNAAFQLWREGIQQKIFIPQFHAREHLNVAEWMRALQSSDRETLLAFDHGLWGFNNKSISGSAISFQAAFDLYDTSDLAVQEIAIKEGLILFEELFGYKATYFVPPNGPFNNQLQKIAAEFGIRYMYSDRVQLEPHGHGINRKLYHWLGQKNQHNQTLITRNCFFEPSMEGKEWVGSCMKNIETSFCWRKPAVISSHRVNYVGALHLSNRINGLKKLDQLLQSILNNWPDAEFFTSQELGDFIVDSRL